MTTLRHIAKPPALAALCAVGAAMALAVAPSHAAVISNTIPVGTIGHWSVDVLGGGQTRSGTVTALNQATNRAVTDEVIYDYFTYLRVGNTSLHLSNTGASLNGSGQVISSGSFAGVNGTVSWNATSTISANSPLLVNEFRFTSTQPLGALSLFQYLDEDVDGDPNNDVFFTRGTAAANNLELFTIDNVVAYGVSHSGAFSAAQGLVNASFIGWAVDNYNGIKERLDNVSQTVSLTGVREAGPADSTNPFVGPVLGPIDIVSVMAWRVDPLATSATIITTLGGLPDVREVVSDPSPATPPSSGVPEPGTLALASLSLLGVALSLRRQAQGVKGQ